MAAATAATAAAWARVAAARGKERLGFAVAPEGPGFAVAPEGMGFAEFPVDWDFAEFPADWGFAAVLVDWGFVNSWPDELRPAPRGMSSSRRRDAQVQGVCTRRNSADDFQMVVGDGRCGSAYGI